MCESNLRLVAWIDGELTISEAAAVAQHVRDCADCRHRVSAYENVSRGFAAYYAAATDAAPATKSPHRVPRWALFAAAAAAVIVIGLMLLPRTQKQSPAPAQVAKVITPIVAETDPKPVEAARPFQRMTKPHVARRRPPIHEDWAIAQPGIQIAIPADSMFPPGAVPEGVAYIANVSFAADGSVQAVRLRP